MKQYEERVYYVYIHQHPCREEFAYIGHGKGPRAWHYGSYLGQQKNASYGARIVEHTKWCESLVLEGYLPSDWVTIISRNMTKKEACALEQAYIREFDPMFNQPLGQKLLKMTKDDLSKSRDMRSQGYSFQQIAQEIGVAVMTVHRALTGGNKNEPSR